jgi:hypothetical protein
MKKLIKFLLIGVPLIIIIGGVALWFGLNQIVESGVEKVGPMITKTDINMESVSISPFSGRGEIVQFDMGNPEGFKSQSILKAKNIVVSVEPKSVMSDVIVVNEIIIEEPEVTYEASVITGSNVSKILENINEFTSKIPSGGTGEEEAPPEEGAAQKKIIIKRFHMNEGKVRVVSKDLMGAGTLLPLPKIDERDIGTETGGVTVGEAAQRTLGIIFKSAGNVGKDGVNITGDAGKTAGDAVKSVGDAIGGLFGKKKEETTE